ncbi:MAG TPA: response regulator [Mucilaginibacter sp.]|nr:response regulator [Mucilaginibacter sp.]
MKILVIEDNLDLKEILDYILKDDGHEVIPCSDGSSLNSLDIIKPDLILMDEILAGSRGSALCRRLKKDEATMHIPVILISAMPNLKEIAAECGADAYIEKPFSIDTLVEIINVRYNKADIS